jgi:RNA polymerase sigma-70 factor (ECF subfamily)
MMPTKTNIINTQAIGAIYDEYFPEIYRYALYRLGDEFLAEDIASDVFIRLLEAEQNGRGPQTNLKGWLIGTASHIITDHLRKKYRHPEDELPASLPDLEPDIAAQLDRRAQTDDIKTALSNLTAEQQHVLSLRFGQGYSIDETAYLMNKNVNAIKALQFRALASLQREIGKVQNG